MSTDDADSQESGEPKYRDAEWLRKQYVLKELSTHEIADNCQCSHVTICNWLDKHDIDTRRGVVPAPDARLKDRGWLRNQYVDKTHSTHEIAEKCDCAHKTVARWLERHDIQTRGHGHAGQDNANWRGGSAPYGSGWNASKRRSVRARDGHTCQDPNCSVTRDQHLERHGQNLHVHHLRKARGVGDVKERNAMENLVTLCRDCHERWEKIADAGLVPQIDRSACE